MGILKESDEHRTDDEPAFYLHDFVSEVESCTDNKYKGILRQKLLIAGLSQFHYLKRLLSKLIV